MPRLTLTAAETGELTAALDELALAIGAIPT
jgi:hypothetical protein